MRTLAFLLLSSCASAACPVATCYYVAASGLDTNTGTDESHPWLHAPGMPNCANNCAAFGMPSSGVGSFPGVGIIFRGGDTWHFGNSGAAPYTGGLWPWHGSGTGTTCDVTDNPSYLSGISTCMYLGVDQTWFTGASWARPVFTGDNPTSTSAVGSCPYQVSGSYLGDSNVFLDVAGQTFLIVDNFEWTGQCNNGNQQYYLNERTPNSNIAQNRYSNNYFHGITHLAFSCPGSVCEGNISLQMSVGSTIGPGNVCDGSDSDPTAFTCLSPGGGGWLMYDNFFGNQSQMVAGGCHLIHDNIWLNYYYSGDGVSHGNQLECNSSAPENDSQGHAQPTTTQNLFYNNVMKHANSGTNGDIKLQFCVNSTYPYYVFNNVYYDMTSGNYLNWGGTGCTISGTQYAFSNTFDLPSSSDALSCNASTTYYNNHIVVEGGVGIGSGSCTTSNNTVMSHATAISQGYMANGNGVSGSNSNDTCANDTTPCAPTAAGNSTVVAGLNEQGLCANLTGSSDASVVRAGNACQKSTTDGCSYNTSNHTMSCPAQTAILRPTIASWDAGAYEYQASGSGSSTGVGAAHSVSAAGTVSN